jgi:hypothetical protein
MHKRAVTLPCTKLDQSNPPHHILFLQDKFEYYHPINIIHLHLWSSLLLSWFLIKILYAFLIPPIYSTCYAHLFLLLLIPFNLYFSLRMTDKVLCFSKTTCKIISYILIFTYLNEWQEDKLWTVLYVEFPRFNLLSMSLWI